MFALFTIAALAGCGQSVRREVIVEYTPKPDKGDILKTDAKTPLHVCVNQIVVRWNTDCNDQHAGRQTWTLQYMFGAEDAPTTTFTTSVVSASEQTRQAKQWENLCLSRIKAQLKAGADAEGKYVVMVDRDALGTIVRENDLKNAGIVETDKSKVKQLGVDMFVFGTVDVLTQYEITYKRDMSAWILNHVPYVPSVFDDSPKQHIRRTITFAGNFRAVDAKTGEQWFLQDFSQQDLQDKKPWPVVGPDRTRLDLVPEERLVKEFFEESVDCFVSRLVKTRVRKTILVESSKDPACAKAVESLRSDENAALVSFDMALAKNPRDHRAAFGAGVALERMRRLPEAQAKYQLAKDNAGATAQDNCGEKGKYNNAFKRVSERIERGEVNDTPVLAARPVTMN